MKTNCAYSAVFCKESEQPSLVHDLTIFRKTLFVDQYGWDLKIEENRERDQFDQDYTIHCALFHNQTIVGTFRAIRTDKPYLAREIFPHLAAAYRLPTHPDIWEISRFGVLSRGNTIRHSRINYALMFHLAHHLKARSLVAIADLTHERFLSTIGIKSRRYGPPQIIGKDRFGEPMRAVVGEIPLHAQSGDKYHRLLNLIEQVDINHATPIFRPTLISARSA